METKKDAGAPFSHSISFVLFFFWGFLDPSFFFITIYMPRSSVKHPFRCEALFRPKVFSWPTSSIIS